MCGAISGFFFQLAKRTLHRIFAFVQGAGRNFQQLLSRSVTVLADQNHFIGRWPGHNTYGPGMYDNFARSLMTRRLDDAVFANLDVTAFIRDPAAEQPGFAHTCCASKTGLRARTNLSTCFSVMMKGGSIRNTVSWVQFRMNPSCRSCLTISLPEIFSSIASI